MQSCFPLDAPVPCCSQAACNRFERTIFFICRKIFSIAPDGWKGRFVEFRSAASTRCLPKFLIWIEIPRVRAAGPRCINLP